MVLKFTKTHEWINAQNTQECMMGITQHAQDLLGDMVYVELPKTGKTVQAGESIAVVESVKAASDVYAPISGVITAVNDSIQAHPEIINSDPYGRGWLIKIKPTRIEEFNQLLDEQQYQHSIEEH